MRYVLINAIGGRRAGEILDDQQGDGPTIAGLSSLGGVLIALPQPALELAAQRATEAYARGAGDEIANGIMLAAFGGPSGGDDHLVLGDTGDTAPGTVFGKLIAGTNIGFTVVDVGDGDLRVQADVTAPAPQAPKSALFAVGILTVPPIPGDSTAVLVINQNYTSETGAVIYSGQADGAITGDLVNGSISMNVGFGGPSSDVGVISYQTTGSALKPGNGSVVTTGRVTGLPIGSPVAVQVRITHTGTLAANYQPNVRVVVQDTRP